MRQLWRAWTGRYGLASWWLVHGLLYLVLNSIPAAYLVLFSSQLVSEPSAGGLFSAIAFDLYFGLPPILFTIALTGIAWAFRGLRRVPFRMVVLLLCSVPMICTPDLGVLWLVAPVQFVYAFMVARPRWQDPLEREHADFIRETVAPWEQPP